MSWFRVIFIFTLLIVSLNAEELIDETASSIYNATIAPLVNLGLLVLSSILVILSTYDQPSKSQKGFRLITYLFIFIIGVNFLSSAVRAPTNYQVYTSINKTKFANVEFTSQGYMVLGGLIGKPSLNSLENHLINSETKILIINSQGGSIDDAINFAALVRKHNLTVVVEDECSSACVLVAAASKQLMSMSDAKFGFHQASTFGDSKSQHSKYWAKYATDTLMSELRKSGIPNNVLAIAEKTPPNDMYYVSAKDMYRYGIVKKLLK